MNDPRIVYRLVPYTVWHVPQGGTLHEMSCMAPYCDATSGPRIHPAAAQDWAARHTGRTGHDLYRRTVTDHTRVSTDAPGLPTG